MAKKETLLQKLNRQADLAGIRRRTKQSQKWFSSKVRLLASNSTFDRLQRDAARKGQQLARDPGIGYMYTYAYKAKGDGQLEYWDRFPLIFVISTYSDGFLGLNLHYLPPKMRAVLFDKLLDLASNDKLSKRTKLQVSYQILKHASKISLIKPTIKRYLTTQIQSKIAKIPAGEWEAAIYLPTESFKGASKTKVWSDSIRKMGKR